MARVVITFEVEDLERWEQAVRTHGELFKRQTIVDHYEYTMIEEDNRVVMSAEVQDIDTYFEVLETDAATAAKSMDGVITETLEFFVLDKQFTF